MLSIVRQIGRRFIDTRRARNNETPLPPMPSTVTLVDVSSCDEQLSPNLDVFTCTVGKKPSAAANYLNDVDNVHECLETLVKVATRDHKFFSALDLRTLDAHKDQMQDIPSFNKKLTSTLVAPLATKSSSMTRCMSMGSFQQPSVRLEVPKVSRSLIEFMGTIEDDDEEDAFFF